jgi:virginiamycin B lyase
MRPQLIALTAFLLVQPFAAGAEQVQYFPVPPGDHPHDVAPAPDGRVWYTGQQAGVLGRLDPKTGSVERIPLGKGSAPHGVIIGPDAGAWVTDSGLNAIVRVDPTTKGVKVWPLPKAGINANLNTAAFDGKGRIWFTGQAGIYGRLDPKTDAMDVWDAPKRRRPLRHHRHAARRDLLCVIGRELSWQARLGDRCDGGHRADDPRGRHEAGVV